MIGQSIGRYKITAKLGEGGMGEVYLAMDTSLDRQVALKFLSKALQNDAEARERLIREAKSVSKLNHKNILTIYAVESLEGRDFLVMEYVEGKSLRERMDVGEDWPIEQILRIGLQICDGLSAAHKQDVIHRDIKPANVLLTSEGEVKIADFGLATWRGATQLTREGTTVGTAAYMSPEQIQGKKTDPRSDIFSLGVVLYEVIARRRPFNGEHDAAISYAITNEIPEPLQRFKSGVHPGLEQIVARALEKDPTTRYQSAIDMLAELKRVRREIEGSQPSMLSRTMKTTPKKSYVKPVLAGSAVLVFALILFVLNPFKFDVATEQKAAASDNSLAVMYFDNIADPSDSDKAAEMATNLLITGLSESRYLSVVSQQRLFDILSSVGGESKKLDHTTASDVATRANVRWVVTGKVFQSSPRVILSAEVADAETGKIVTTQRVNGNDGEDIFAVVDKLGASLRDNLALPEAAKMEDQRAVADVTTHSTEAYRHFLEGVEFTRKHYTDEAIASLQKAVALDSTYAMAWYRLATVSDPIGKVSTAERNLWLAHAEKYADRAGWKEQRYIRTASLIQKGEQAAALDVYREILARYPDESEALRRVGQHLRGEGNLTGAIAIFERMIAIDSTDKIALNNLAYTHNTAGDLEKSLWAINRYIALAPDEANPYDTRGDLYAYNGKPRDAMESYRAALRENPEFESAEKLGWMYIYVGNYDIADSVYLAMANSPDQITRALGRTNAFLVPAYQGKFSRALINADEAIGADRLEGYKGNLFREKLVNRTNLLVAAGRHADAIRSAEEAAAFRRQEVPTDIVYGRTSIIQCHAVAGDIDGAKRILEEIRRDVLKAPDTATWADQLRFAESYIAFYEGRMDDVITRLEKLPMNRRGSRSSYCLAHAYIQSGELEKAVNMLELFNRYLDGSQIGNPYDGVRCIYLLGVAYEQSGWKDKAAEQYKKFLEIWKDADAGIEEIADAKARLAKLAS